jgi:hypothetical protein
MTFSAPSDADKRRFLEVYNEVAERNARLAARFEIDGLRLFHYARTVVARADSGAVQCHGERE